MSNKEYRKKYTDKSIFQIVYFGIFFLILFSLFVFLSEIESIETEFIIAISLTYAFILFLILFPLITYFKTKYYNKEGVVLTQVGTYSDGSNTYIFFIEEEQKSFRVTVPKTLEIGKTYQILYEKPSNKIVDVFDEIKAKIKTQEEINKDIEYLKEKDEKISKIRTEFDNIIVNIIINRVTSKNRIIKIIFALCLGASITTLLANFIIKIPYIVLGTFIFIIIYIVIVSLIKRKR